MSITLTVDISFPRRYSRAFAFFAIPVLVLGASTMVHADVSVPNTFNAGDLVSAAAINDNFKVLQDAVNKATVLHWGAARYSVGPTLFVATTPAIYNGIQVGGYTGAKAKCEAAAKTSTAHLCQPDELVRSMSLGVAVPLGWNANGSQAYDSSHIYNDCQGWTSSASDLGGARWSGYPSSDSCSNSYPLLCCD